MSISSIGIQTIMPKTGTSPKQAPPQPANERDTAASAAAKQASPPPAGMGKFVDKTA